MLGLRKYIFRGGLKQRLPVIAALFFLLLAVLWVLGGNEEGIIIAGDTTGATASSSKASDKVSDSGVVAQKPERVRVFASQAQIYRPSLHLTGSTQPKRRLDVQGSISGRVIGIRDKGDIVSEGDVLVWLAPEDRPAQLEHAKSEVILAEHEYRTAHSLHKKGFESELHLVQRQAALSAARADLAKARVEVDDLQIKAAFAGIVTAKMVEVGDFLQAGEAALSLIQLHPLVLTAQLSEKHYYAIREGQEAEAHLLNGDMARARIGYLSSTADVATRTFAMEIDIDNSEYRHPVGSTVELRLSLPEVRGHRIRSSHLSLNDAGELGVKVVEDGKARFYKVRIVSDDDGILWVSGDFVDDIVIIAEGHGFVGDGQAVIAEFGEPQ